MRYINNLLKTALKLNEIQPIWINFAPQRGLRFKAGINWIKPWKKPIYHPSNTGDLVPYEKPPKNTIRLGFEKSSELQSASDAVKKVFSLEYLPPRYSYLVYEAQMVDKVKAYEGDINSLEVKIARYTAAIRYNRERLAVLPKSKRGLLMTRVKELIDKRQKKLKVLRKRDYKKFEWILEELQLLYKPRVFTGRVTKKEAITLLAQLTAEKNKEFVLGNFKKTLSDQKVPFLEKKLEKLKWIQTMEKNNNLEQTVTDDDINECSEKLEKVKIEVAEGRNFIRRVHPFTLERYHEDLLIEKEKASQK
ncbi:hypothetical protein RUM44_003908 [Polyplax serrata]|uniref:Small ribosomal subunit protein uS15m n=1 Tax=Polyplax serrata TaxID=468196 RepID=A0ABR1B1B8_POLSC